MERIVSVRDLDCSGKKVFLRLDLNVPVKEGKITDDTRITASLPTIKHLLDKGAAIVACSHMGRPKGLVVPGLSMAPVAERLRELLPGVTVHLSADAVGPDAKAKAEALKVGEILLLENVRFEAGETKDDKDLATRLAALAEVYVNDAFGAAHRAHASVHAQALMMEQRGMGFLMEQELVYLHEKLGSPARPYTALLGGAKVSDKIPILKALVEKVDALCIGGAMAYTFIKAGGGKIGSSLLEEDQMEASLSVVKRAKERGIALLLPVDHVAAPSMESPEPPNIIVGNIPDGLSGFDIGPETRALFAKQIATSKTILWNGPMGVFEKPPFAAGTVEIAKAVAASGALSVVGGGDSVSAVNKAGVADKITHISTGGGASLELLSGLELPGVKALER